MTISKLYEFFYCFFLGSIAGIAIGLLAVGLLIGLAVGVFFCIYKPNLLPLDKISGFSPLDTLSGFKNPGYKDNNASA